MPGICSVDTSPLVYLFRIGHLELLDALFDQVLTPHAVVRELERGLRGGARTPNLADFPWIQTIEPTATEIPQDLLDFGPGEQASILLVLENRAQVVVLDDLEARRVAERLRVPVIGTVGLLAGAKHKGLIPSVSPLLDQLVQAGMWLSDDLKRRVLDLAKE